MRQEKQRLSARVLYRLIHWLGSVRGRGPVAQQLGREQARELFRLSRRLLPGIIDKTPDIGKSVFALNYAFTPAYIAWYRAAECLRLSRESRDNMLWTVNEEIISAVPGPLTGAFGRAYLRGFRRNAPRHQRRMDSRGVHPYDYLLQFEEGDRDSFSIVITRCGMMTLARDFDALGLFPAVCRVDYLLAHHMGMGFARTMTLGDGDRCCDCRYTRSGRCPWPLPPDFPGR